MKTIFEPLALGQVRLKPGRFQQRYDVNRAYMLSLKTANLLQNFYLEAGLWSPPGTPETLADQHWGWETPSCQVRGHFLGHWLSAAARAYATTGDLELKGKADTIIAELARCQKENGGEWVFSIPSGYLDWVARGKSVWAPHYTIHKTLMGLYDMAAFAGSAQAMEVLENAARWFHRWSGQFSREQMDDILDMETGGMLEAWANLYGASGRQEHLDLVHRYDRPRLFERLLKGEDPLTNRHANTTIPEAQGAARAYEVTGDERWRKVVEAYWRCAVTERGTYATGGQTDGEIWTPPFALAARLGDKNQEHCVVYNMVRLADYLLRWSGDPLYADYMERNLYNGTLAQQHPVTGQIAYFLPMAGGSVKKWGHPTHDFWCCHGSLVQAHTTHNAYNFYQDADGVAVCQYIPSEATFQQGEVPVRLSLALDPENSDARVHLPDNPQQRPARWVVDLSVQADQITAFDLKLRLPWWLSGPARVTVNEQAVEMTAGPSAFQVIRRTWQNGDRVRLELPSAVTACPLPDEPGTVAFMDGPVVLAGLCSEERTLVGDPSHPEALLVPDNEREWSNWKGGYRARGQERGLRFLPLHEVTGEAYTVYFPVVKPKSNE
jgi:uncharacterized protein